MVTGEMGDMVNLLLVLWHEIPGMIYDQITRVKDHVLYTIVVESKGL